MEILSLKGVVSEELKAKIRRIDDSELLNRFFKEALEASVIIRTIFDEDQRPIAG